jgi:hypothetical protein
MKPHWQSLKPFAATLLISGVLSLAACGSGSSVQPPHGQSPTQVNSLEDLASPPSGTVTLRSALAAAASGDTITFSTKLNGSTIRLNIVGENHSILMGEVYSGMTYQGYAERDYGKSALYARKNVTIDASNLTNGITILWDDSATHARVLAVYGDLTLKNVTIAGGNSTAEQLPDGAQPYTLARGGGLAVWGIATLSNCTIKDNQVVGDIVASRDRGTYGGGVFADAVKITNCVISGNSAMGYGAAGGGVYSVGGSDYSNSLLRGVDSEINQSTVSGNRVTAQHAYGGGVFSLGGGPTNRASMSIANSTIARNLVQDNPDLPEAGPYYYRGGGIYLGGGSLYLSSSTVVENEVNGNAAIISGKPNVGGGGIAATIGDAHVVEEMDLQHSIIAGNKLNSAANDLFSGSLINFYSYGYNRIGTIDFSQILVPVPNWDDLNRKHYPKVGDLDGVALTDVVLVDQAQKSRTIASVGPDAGQPAVMWYPPAVASLAKVPAQDYIVTTHAAGYSTCGVPTDDFLNQVLAQIRSQYGATLGNDFGKAEFGDLTGVTFYGPAVGWPSASNNAPWITFWRNLDTLIGEKLGSAKLNEDFWANFPTGHVGNEIFSRPRIDHSIKVPTTDQRGSTRTGNRDIGAIEQ